ncbi:MAG TPA: ferric reductase-like transmembrane domain-containing protein [Acidimicrobiia bacterium]|nr:ferric reductase-like transmembrane domain-containing protein [Acidimicrobiia bacterium]
MNQQLWWHVARAGGIVAWVLLALSVGWGLLLSTRLLGRRAAPAWLTDLHRFLGALALVFTVVHVAGLVADSYVHFGWSELFVPYASEWKPGAVAWGIVALYLLLAVELTSLVMRRIPRKWWKGVHLSSFGLFFAASVHGATAGSDATNLIYRATSAAMIAGVLFLTLVRILADSPRARRTAQRSAGGRVVSARSEPTGDLVGDGSPR